MKGAKIAIFGGGSLALIVILAAVFFYGVGIENRYIDLENVYDKQVAKLETFHDKMWKTIKSQAKVTDKAKDAFKDIYIGIMEGRYSKGDGTLMKWIKEDNPQFDQTMYTKLMTTIEAQRTAFHNEQDIMQGIVKEMNDLREKFPSKYWLRDKPEAKFIPISSTVSKNVMETRTDDDLHLGD
jgi:hypothetical protein